MDEHDPYHDLMVIQDCINDPKNVDNSIRTFGSNTNRLRKAITAQPSLRSDLEMAVLLRQFLNYCNFHMVGTEAELALPVNFMENFSDWDLVNIAVRKLSGHRMISSLPWEPTWLPTQGKSPDVLASSELQMRDFQASAVVGDPFLGKFNFTDYRSSGQRSAIRGAMSTPAGESLIVNLPTGEGKSFVFQAIHKLGFCDLNGRNRSGLTLVIVPTVSLGLDQEMETARVCDLELPLFYESANDLRRQNFIDQIEAGVDTIIFASPEAAIGPLKSALIKAARNGTIKALVIDEAHLVDEWGVDFRDEFQTLGSLRHRLIIESPDNLSLRTFFLSATLSPSAQETLEIIFNGGNVLESINAGALRKEPIFVKARKGTSEDQYERVKDAMFNLPRPCILYVTTQIEAKLWHQTLLKIGFKSVDLVHGTTPPGKRRDVIESWKNDELDVVVGTSAFGIGINKANVRSIVHACVPETLDRYYQEVGRGGRDGKKSISLIIPKYEDFDVSRSISNRTIISTQRGWQRWRSMFNQKVIMNDGKILIPYDVSPGTSIDDIDMVSDLNTRWNLRVLNLLVRSKAITILGPPDLATYLSLNNRNVLEIKINNDDHLSDTFWANSITQLRTKIWQENIRNNSLMWKFLHNETCPAEIFSELYGDERIQTQCSTCLLCAENEKKRFLSAAIREPQSPYSFAVTENVERMLGITGRMLVCFDSSSLNRRTARRFTEAVLKLRLMGVYKFIEVGTFGTSLVNFKEQCAEENVFFESLKKLTRSKMPEGPELIFIGQDAKLGESHFAQKNKKRIFVTDPSYTFRGGRRLVEVFQGRQMSLDEFIREVNS